MIRVLPILAAVFALAVTAAPASALEPPTSGPVPIPYPNMASKVHGTQTYGSPDEPTYLRIELENVQITNYQ
jgi:hypothetical protein